MPDERGRRGREREREREREINSVIADAVNVHASSIHAHARYL